MPDFDPKNLDHYIPPDMLPISEAAKAILAGRVHAAYIFNDHLMQDERLSESEIDELIASSHDIPKLHQSPALQNWSWSELRHRLILCLYQAHALDEDGNLHPIGKDLWISEYGNIALSTGNIDRIPLYKPRGAVLIARKSVDELFRKSFDDTMANLEPPTHKFPSLAAPTNKSTEENDVDVLAQIRGAKRKYDVELFLHEAFAIIYDGNPMPKTQADLGTRAADAYAAKDGKGGRPSDPWVRATVAKLWRRLELGQE